MGAKLSQAMTLQMTERPDTSSTIGAGNRRPAWNDAKASEAARRPSRNTPEGHERGRDLSDKNAAFFVHALPRSNVSLRLFAARYGTLTAPSRKKGT